MSDSFVVSVDLSTLHFSSPSKSSAHTPISPVKVAGEASPLSSHQQLDTSPGLSSNELEGVLLRVFMFYCSYGDPLNIEYMTQTKFFKFVRDCHLLNERLKQVDVDLIFSTVVKRLGVGHMNLEQFKLCLQEVAIRKFPPPMWETPMDSLRELVSKNILPFANHNASEHDEEELYDQDVVIACDKCRVALHEVFETYAALEIKPAASLAPNKDKTQTWGDRQKSESSINLAEFLKLAEDFELTPLLLSKPVLSKIFCASNVGEAADDNPYEMSFDEFLEALKRCALVALSRYPYNIQYVSAGEKIVGFLKMMQLYEDDEYKRRLRPLRRFVQSPSKKSPTKQKQRQQRMGTNVGSPTKGYTPKAANFAMSARVMGDSTRQQESVEDRIACINDKGRLDEELRQTFLSYCNHGEHLQTDWMSPEDFQRFVKDCGLLDNLLSQVEADRIYTQVVRSRGQGSMKYEQFCEALGQLAIHKFPGQASLIDALNQLLVRNVLPLAVQKSSDTAPVDGSDVLVESDVAQFFGAHRRELMRLFTLYSKTAPSRSKGQGDEATYLMQNELLKLCDDFEITPGLVTRHQVVKMFNAVHDIDNSPFAEGISYPEFMEILARIAVTKFGKHPYTQQLHTTRDRVTELFTRMDLSDNKFKQVQSDSLSPGRDLFNRNNRIHIDNIAQR